jgi:4,4'-diaponeurosporenoate glycosyltransferase
MAGLPMLILLAVSLLLCSAGLFLGARLVGAMRRGVGTGGVLHDVSVIIPARNEEKNLPRLLQSIEGQSEDIREIIVVDDDSTDGTARIAAAMGARVVCAGPLPDGWRGKAWACHQGTHEAVGRHFLFLDADTWFEQGGLQEILDNYPGGAVSVGPWHVVEKPYEHLSFFFNVNMVLGTVPDALFGQMLLVDRTSYKHVGGHERVKGHVLENLMLAAHLRAAGIPVRSTMSAGEFCFRMYQDGIAELIRGWRKGFSSGAGSTPWKVLAPAISWMSGLMMVPIGWLATGSWWFAAAYFACVLHVFWLSRMIGNFRILMALFYPAPLIFFFCVFGLSAARLNKASSWKGRPLRAA